MTDSRKRRVLLVTTSEPMREVIAHFLVDCNVTSMHMEAMEDGGALPRIEAHSIVLVDLDGQVDRGLEWLIAIGRVLPWVPKLAMVRQGDASMAVQAMRAGALDCIEKPVEEERLRAAIQELDPSGRDDHRTDPKLTRMEKTVLHYVLQGRTTQHVARALHRSPRTIEVHRRNIMRKLQVSCLADLVKKAARLGLLGSWDKR